MTKQKQKKESIGSSETTREASGFRFDLDLAFEKSSTHLYQSKALLPLENKKEKTVFLEWFVGFTEGDGSFVLTKVASRTNLKSTRPSFHINQKNPQVLYKIKKELGFGRVHFVREKKSGATYYRYSVSRLQGVKTLILLFNGNLVLDKVQARFIQWVNAFNTLSDQRNALPYIINPAQQALSTKIVPHLARTTTQINLNSAWLSGFTDAEGGFYVSLSPNKRFSTGFRERYKFYITQKGELKLLHKIDELLQIETLKQLSLTVKPKDWENFSHICKVPNKTDVYRLEFTRLQTLVAWTKYFDRYPLLSKKQLVFVRWRRVLLHREAFKKAALASVKGMRRYKRVFASIGKIREATKSK